MGEELTTGREADVPAEDSLLRAYVLAPVDRSEAIARAVGGRVERTDAVAMVDTGSPILFDNVATFLRPLTADEAERAIARPPRLPATGATVRGVVGLAHRRRGRPRRPPHGPSPLHVPAGRIAARGLGRRTRAAQGRRRGRAGDVHAHARRGVPHRGRHQRAADPGILDTDVRFWVGYEGDRPIGTAGVLVAHGQNDVEWISVYPDCRGKGYGAALTWAATLADPTLPATLIASDPGQPVYERMGYVRLTRMSMWFRPPD